MQPQIITVHDISQSIDNLGVEPFANSLVQEMAGGYSYIEAEQFGDVPDDKPGYEVKQVIEDGVLVTWWQYHIHPVPLRLAWFVIEALALKSAALNMGNHTYPKGRQYVYLPEGAEIFGNKITLLTEIPAKMGPIVVDRL